MIGVDFFNYKVKTDLEREITQFANNKLLEMYSFVMDVYTDKDSNEYVLEALLPAHYVREHGEKCINAILELKEIITGSFCRESIKPLYEYILYNIISFNIGIDNDNKKNKNEYIERKKEKNSMYFYEVPMELRKKMIKELGRSETNYIIKQLENIENYLEFFFWDWDFIYNVELIHGLTKIYGKEVVDLHLGLNIDEYMDLIPIDLKEQYLKSDSLQKASCNSMVKFVLIALTNSIIDLERRIPECYMRNEVTLSNDINSYIKMLLSDKNIISTREYQMGRATINLGETDFYLYSTNEYGENIDIAIIENKVVEKFSVQYKQLLGYLNQNFKCGITLSINKKKSCEKARKDIIQTLSNELKVIQFDNFVYKTDLVELDCIHPLVAISEHEIPENPKIKMKVYHFLLNLYDEPRKNIAQAARTKRSGNIK